MFILGISYGYHDSAACIYRDSELIAAAQEERFSRLKNDDSFPSNAIVYCLKEADIKPHEVDQITFYEKPLQKFDRLFETSLSFAPHGFWNFKAGIPVWLKSKLFQKSQMVEHFASLFGNATIWKDKIHFSNHHLSHAASAFFPSPFQNAAILTVDAVGEWPSTSIAFGSENKIRTLKEIHFPHSLGLLYSAFTYFLGFKVNSGEYKVMGLAPYGKPIFSQKIKDNLIQIHDDGSFHLNLDFFGYCHGLTMINDKFEDLFKAKSRTPESTISSFHMDVAASIQQVCEEAIIKLAKHTKDLTGQHNLCLAGGVALNCVANAKLKSQGLFDSIWVQPASGDAGGALGAALASFHLQHNGPRKAKKIRDDMKSSYVGPEYSTEEIAHYLDSVKAKYRKLSFEKVCEVVVDALIDEKAVGWMQGRMEFGPRALGNRSILGNPMSHKTQKDLNLKVKFRESFRPFAPSVLAEHAEQWFDVGHEIPYMSFVAELALDKRTANIEKEQMKSGLDMLKVKRSQVPAVTHVDFTSRLQTVTQRDNPKFHQLIDVFFQRTGVPMIVNTSFNVRGEPIVCSPQNAYECFMKCGLDLLVIGDFVLRKEEQLVN